MAPRATRATRQTSDPTQGATQQDPAVTNTGPLPSGSQGASSSAPSPASPLGVPFYNIDPKTGLPVGLTIGPDGKVSGTPQRWTASTLGTQNATSAAGQLVHGGSYNAQQLPRYFDGDQWLPAQLPPDKIRTLQKSMVAAGLLKATDVTDGVWDTNSMNAYTQVLGNANARGVDVGTALTDWVNQKQTAPTTPLPTQLTPDADLEQVFRKASIDLTGRGMDKNQIASMISAYHATETQSQTQANVVQQQGQGQSTPAPSASAFAEQQIRDTNPVGVAENKAVGSGGIMDALNSVIGKWSPKTG